jgi:BirA family biotin operon repressor/biotin-[acetyl-CoA-carboxylase] ligase
LFNHIHFDSTTSTNLVARKLIEDTKPEAFTVISSDFQVQGRGQAGNTWESEASKNLLFSIILYPDFVPAHKQFIINQLISVSISIELELLLPQATINIKWPNDLLVNRKKIAGILIENSVLNSKLGWSIAGIGLNVNQEKFGDNLPLATSLLAILGRETERTVLLTNIVNQIQHQFTVIQRDEGFLLNTLYMERLFQLKQQAQYRHNGELFTATITKIDNYGRLVLMKNDHEEVFCDVKEIEFVYT